MNDLDRLTAQSSPAGFAWVAEGGNASGDKDRGWLPFEHLTLLSDKLMQVTTGQCRRLIVTMPPRHGKSQLISQYFPAWYMGRHPRRQMIVASNTATLAYNFSRSARNALSEHGPEVFGVGVRDDSRAADRWHTTQGGVLIAAGVGGPLTGRGAHCLPAGTMVETEIGPVEIGELVRLERPPRVVTLQGGATTYRRIVATHTGYRDDIYEIETTAGLRLRASGDHRVFVPGCGYTETAHLRPGDGLVVLAHAQEQALRGVRSAKAKRIAGADVPRVLQRGPAHGRGSDVLVVREGLHAQGLRGAQGDQEELDGCLLLGRVSRCAHGDQEPSAVRGLRCAVPEEDDALLLAGVQAREQAAAREGLSGVRRGVHDRLGAHDLLLAPVRELGALGADEGRGQLEPQGRHELRALVPQDAAVDPRARGPLLRSVQGAADVRRREAWGGGTAPVDDRHPPHRREPAQQHAGEPDRALQDLPCDPPQVADDTVAVVRRVRTGTLPVYDLQVEGEHHFFADGLLVHNCLIIDDPIKNSEEAHSETIREKQWEWWQSTARTRLMRDASVVVVLTRWHEDDLAGKLLRQAEENPLADQWELLNLPAFAEEGDALGREEGAALCDELISRAELEQTKASTSSYWWGAMYQQRPSPDEGGIFRRGWWRWWRDPSEFEVKALCQSWDLSFKDGDGSDYVAGQLWGTDQAERILLAQVHARLDFPSTLRAIRAMHGYASRHWPQFASHPVYVEEAANGAAVIASLKRELPGVIGVRPDGGKIARAHNVAHIPEAGQVRLPEGLIPAPEGYERTKADAFVDELASFPNGAHDDQVDALTQALSKLARSSDGRVRGGGSGARDRSG